MSVLSHKVHIIYFWHFGFIVPLRHAVVSLTFVSVHAVRTCRGGRWGSPEFERVRCTVCFTCCCQRVSVHACMHFGVLLRHSCLTHFVSVHAARPCRGGRWGGPEFERVRCIVCFTCCCQRVSVHACMACQSQLQFATSARPCLSRCGRPPPAAAPYSSTRSLARTCKVITPASTRSTANRLHQLHI